MSVLLVIACSGFARRADIDADYDIDRALYLKQQHHALSTLKYSCDVVLVNSGGSPGYREYLDTLRGTYHVIDRENRGMSLGAFSDAWKLMPDYDYYILLEDDYLFVLDYFDEEMVEMLEAEPNCGYMCQVANSGDGHNCIFPAFMNGIASRALLDCLGGFLKENEPSNHGMGDQMQKDFGSQIRDTRKFRLADMGSRFRAPFRHIYEIKVYYPDAPYDLIVPSQTYTREV